MRRRGRSRSLCVGVAWMSLGSAWLRGTGAGARAAAGRLSEGVQPRDVRSLRRRWRARRPHRQLGIAISGDGNTIAVGAQHESSNARGINGNQNDDSAYNAGAVYVFTRNGANWTQQAYVKASNAGSGRSLRQRRRPERRRQHDGRGRVLGVERRHRRQRQPERRLDPAGGRGVRLHAQRHDLDAAGVHQGVEHRERRASATCRATAISSASRWR